MRFTLEIDSGGNAAMQTADEVRAAIGAVKSKIHAGEESGAVMDANGNSVGYWRLIPSADDVEFEICSECGDEFPDDTGRRNGNGVFYCDQCADEVGLS